MSIAVIGGLVAKGECANELVGRGKGVEEIERGEGAEGWGIGRPGRPGGDIALGVGVGWLVRDGVAAMGGAPELNSAHRGHFLFVSRDNARKQRYSFGESCNLLIWPI